MDGSTPPQGRGALPGAEAPERWGDLVRVLYRHARHLGAPAEEAEDLVHDALAHMTRDPSWYDPARGPIDRVLRVVVTNRWRDRCRRRSRRGRLRGHLALVSQDAGDGPERSVRAGRAAARRRALLARLDDDEWALFTTWISQHHRELDARAAAASLGIEVREYENRKKRLRRRCRALVEELGLSVDDLFTPAAGGGVR